jgi:hypothetical protein
VSVIPLGSPAVIAFSSSYTTNSGFSYSLFMTTLPSPQSMETDNILIHLTCKKKAEITPQDPYVEPCKIIQFQHLKANN